MSTQKINLKILELDFLPFYAKIDNAITILMIILLMMRQNYG
jgi:hypothetical protein